MAKAKETQIITPEMAKIPAGPLKKKCQTDPIEKRQKSLLQKCSLLLLHIFSFSIIVIGAFFPSCVLSCQFPLITSVVFGLVVVCMLCALIRKEIGLQYIPTALFPACVFIILVWLLTYNLIEATWLAAGLFLLVLTMYLLLSIKKQFNKESGLLTLEFVMYYLITYIRYANF